MKIKHLQILLLITISFIVSNTKPSIPKFKGDDSELLKKCLDFSQCDKNDQCKLEMEKCKDCQKEQSWYSMSGNDDFNKEIFQCYNKCLYKNIDKESGQDISEGAFDLLFCFKNTVMKLPKYLEPKTAYVIPAHYLIKNVLKEKRYSNWKIVENPQYNAWNLKWDFYYHRFKFNKNVKHQMGNKLENVQQVLGDKVAFFNLLQNYDKNDFYPLKSNDFFPETYVVNLLKQQQKKEKELYKDTRDYWIVKSPSGYGGDGIMIVKTMKELQQYIQNSRQQIQQQYQKTGQVPQDTNAIIQKYIEDPLLIDNKKFDIRNFVLIACSDPFLILYHKGYFRKSLIDFDMDISPFDLDVKVKHLTNSSMQEKSKQWQSQKLRESHGITHDEAMEWLRKEENYSDEDINKLNQDMEEILAYLYTASLDKLKRKEQHFHLTGMDFMMDKEKKLYFLEANQNPRLQEKWHGERIMSPIIAQSTIDIIMQINQVLDKQERTRLIKQHEKYLELFGWKVLINEATNYNILDDEKYQNIKESQQQKQKEQKDKKTDL